MCTPPTWKFQHFLESNYWTWMEENGIKSIAAWGNIVSHIKTFLSKIQLLHIIVIKESKGKIPVSSKYLSDRKDIFLKISTAQSQLLYNLIVQWIVNNMSLFLLNDKFIHILFFLSDLQAQNEEEDKSAEEDKKC